MKGVMKGVIVWIFIAIFVTSGICVSQDKSSKRKRGYLGIVTRHLDGRTKRELGYRCRSGVLVIKVLPNSPARKKDIFADDIIKEIDGKKIKFHEELRWIAMRKGAGATVKLKIWRNGKEKEIEVKLSKWPKKDLEYTEEEKKRILQRGI